MVLTVWLSIMAALGGGLPPGRLPDLGAQGLMNPGPEFGVAPIPEVPVDSLPFGKVVGQATPGTARPQQIQDGIYQGAPLHLDRPPLGPRWWQQRAQQLPLATIQVTGVALVWGMR